MGKHLTKAEFLSVLHDVEDKLTVYEIMVGHAISSATTFRVKHCAALIKALDPEAVNDSERRHTITPIMAEWTKEEIYRRLDEMTRPEPKETAEPVKGGCPGWFVQGANALPELSSLLKTLALAIDTALDAWKEEGAGK